MLEFIMSHPWISLFAWCWAWACLAHLGPATLISSVGRANK